MSGAALRLEDVACLRGGRLLFEGVALSLGEGDALLVTGANGAGKSSLLRIAAGLLRAAAGTVTRVGTVALADERAALDERRNVRQALQFWAALDRRDPAPGLEAMGLEPLAHVPVRMLSTGQRKRAALARLIASEAPIWLLDEPANGLDAEGQARLATAMARHRAGGGIILAATHQPIGLDAPELRL